MFVKGVFMNKYVNVLTLGFLAFCACSTSAMLTHLPKVAKQLAFVGCRNTFDAIKKIELEKKRQLEMDAAIRQALHDCKGKTVYVWRKLPGEEKFTWVQLCVPVRILRQAQDERILSKFAKKKGYSERSHAGTFGGGGGGGGALR